MDFGSPPVARCPFFLMGQLTALGTGRGLSQPSYQPLTAHPLTVHRFWCTGLSPGFVNQVVLSPEALLPCLPPSYGVADGTWDW